MKPEDMLDWVAECPKDGHPDWYLDTEADTRRSCPTCAVEQAEAEREHVYGLMQATIERNGELLAERDALKAAAGDALVVLTGDVIGNPVLPEVRKRVTDALDAALAVPESTEEPAKPKHIGGRANAEDCPACSGTNPPYPFICPGEPEGERNEYVTCSECGRKPIGNYPVAHEPSCSRMTLAPHLWPSPGSDRAQATTEETNDEA